MLVKNVQSLIEFEKNKLKYGIATHGTALTFFRDILNEFNEPTGDAAEIITITGIYHDIFNGYVSKNVQDGAEITKNYQPMFLCLKDDSGLLNIGDYTVIDNIKYRVNDLKDVNNLGYAIDISFEVYSVVEP